MDELKTEIFEYLNKLRDSGKMNMFGARPLVAEMFGIDKNEAGKYLTEWMDSK